MTPRAALNGPPSANAGPEPSARPAALALAKWALAQLAAAGLLAALFAFVAGLPPKPEPPPAGAGPTAGLAPGGLGGPAPGAEAYGPGGGSRGGTSGPAPAFRLPSLAGETTSLADYKGKVVVLDFWATWCGPCRQQAVILEEMHQRLGQQVVFLGINVGEDKQTVERYVQRSPFPYRTLLDPSQQVAAKYQAEGLPTLVVIGPRGEVVFHNVGVTSASRLSQAIQAAAAS